eukprot:7739375-Alexandrium_andersonii.AAC.1
MFLPRRTGTRYSARGSPATAASRQTASLAPPLTASDPSRLWKIGEPAGRCLCSAVSRVQLSCARSLGSPLSVLLSVPIAACLCPPLIGALPHPPPSSAPRAMAQLD